MSTDYTILAAPRISKAGFAAILQAAGSPAATVADQAYDAIVEHGVDPCLELAMFRKESSFGTTGVARTTHSWGNNTDGHGQFVNYADWVAGAAGTAWQLAVYGENRIRPGTTTDTALTMPFVWAPAADHNAPATYGAELVSWMGEWIAAYPVDAAPEPEPEPAPAEPPAPSTTTYTVVPGDSLSAIAAHFTGDADRWPEIYAANRSAVGDDPNLIHPGLVLELPASWPAASPGTSAPAEPPPAPADGASARTTVTVQAGDSLFLIAERLTGDGNRWHELYQANRGAIGSNPSLIHPGLVLRVPAGW